MTDNIPTIRITADEVNCLIYSFLVDSGFKHTAFSLCMEANLEKSQNFVKHIPRGELVDLLSKALLYREVEAHWRADNLSRNCKANFSLLDAHVCSLVTRVMPQALASSYTRLSTEGKRKASHSAPEGPAEKRLRQDTSSEGAGNSQKQYPLVTSDQSASTSSKRTQGPENSETDVRSIIMLAGHQTEVFVCAFNPTKKSILATGSKDTMVNLWNLPQPPPADSPYFAEPPPSGPCKTQNFNSTDLTALHWNPEGTLVAIASLDSLLRVCSSEGEVYFTHNQHRQSLYAVRFSPTGQWLLSASLDGSICLWDVANKQLKTQYPVHTDCCLDVDWISESIFASCGADHIIQVMQVGVDKPIRTLRGHTQEVNQIKVNPAGTRLASSSDDKTVRIWPVNEICVPGENGSEPNFLNLAGHTHSVSAAFWCPDPAAGVNEVLATSSFDHSSKLWDSRTGECIVTFSDHKRPIYTLRFNPIGNLMATGSGDGWVHVYDIRQRVRVWSWCAGVEKPGVFEIDWQNGEGIDRMALALESQQVAVVDVSKVPALQRVLFRL